ncbi:hypothetical protein [Nonomuraea roseola]|uniref:Uncharacterized protein n=1 Tax=Nonomuraea roseola TaxID=46179 RepID=A0ABV5QDG8_9ACTN
MFIAVRAVLGVGPHAADHVKRIHFGGLVLSSTALVSLAYGLIDRILPRRPKGADGHPVRP